MHNRATFHDVAVIGDQSHDVLAVFGHVQKLAAILVNVGYLKMIVRCRTTPHDIVRRRDSSYDICAIIVRRRRTTSSMIVRRRRTSSRIVRHRTTVIQSYNTISQTLPMRRKPIVSSVTTKLRLQYRSRVGGHRRSLV